MKDETFGELEYEEDYGYTGHQTILFGGKEQTADVLIICDEEEEISQFQRDVFAALMQGWDVIQHKITAAILQYYNNEEKGSYGPEDEEEFRKWWPDIDSEEELVKFIRPESIVIQPEYVMESKGKNPVYVLFNRDWGGEDTDDNGVAVFIEDGKVTETGYKDIAF